MQLRPRVIIPVQSPPLVDRAIGVSAGRITSWVHGSAERASDLGDVALLPGLVNAHTHLELSYLSGRVPFEETFAGWIGRLISERRRCSDDASRSASIRSGVEQSLAAGVTTVGDIGYGPWQTDALSASPIRSVAFAEVLGIGTAATGALHRADEMEGALRIYAARAAMDALRDPLHVGISPHAPYSTSAEVYRRCVARAKEHGWRITTHLAETREEIEFLRDGKGPLRELLDSRGILPAGWTPPGCSPVEFAESVGLLEMSPLLAHVNYVTDEEITRLARHDCHVAYCPRTHRFFGHEPHRFREMLDRGINVCVATDSLASNPSLSVLEELQFLRREHPDVSPQTLLEMGTIRGARALGLERVTGSIALGKQADLVALRMTARTPQDAIEEILAGETSVHSVYVAGRRVWPVDESTGA
jgi:cytosine/adenosine deaminase-related metal-dependent hydrolase